MAAAEVDIAQLVQYTSIPESSFQTLLDAPTVALVTQLLEAISRKSKEYQHADSQNVKLEVELENTVQAGETRAKALKAQVDKAHKETAELRRQLQERDASNQSLQTRLQNATTSTSSSSAELEGLRSRISSLEASNQDTLSLLETKSSAYNDLSNELSAKQEKVIDLRQELATAEQNLRKAQETASTAQFKEQSLQQEVDSLKRSNDWYENELQTKSSEYTKFRKDRNARVAELQRQNEELNTEVESLRRTERTLRSRVEELTEKCEEYLQQIQNLRDDISRQEESFRAETNTANRLSDLMKKSMETEKARQQEVSEELDRIKDEAAEELGKLASELETEHGERLSAEKRIVELETQVERLETDVAANATIPIIPDTPAKRLNGSAYGTPRRDGTPSRNMSPARSGMLGNVSYTQMISDYHAAKADLEKEKRHTEKLERTVDELLQSAETSQPLIAELREENERFEKDFAEMSELTDELTRQRDEARKEARRKESEIVGLQGEAEVLRQQLHDLSSQIKILLLELNAHSRGDFFTQEQRTRLEQLAQVDFDTSQDMTATDDYISRNLTTFRSVAEMQEQNQKMLRLVRELGQKMEGEEAQIEKQEALRNKAELEELHQKYDNCRDEIKSIVAQSNSYIRERDMFRRMLTHRGQIPRGADVASLFGESVQSDGRPATPDNRHSMNGVDRSPSAKDLADYAKLLKEMQTTLDNYQQEAAGERRMLKDEVTALSQRNSELRNENSRKTGEVSLAVERYEMLQGNYSLLKVENSELQKRSQSASEQAAKQELRIQQVAEELIEARGLVESMRNETANLKAEKEFWKAIEKRLTEDNANLIHAQDRLNTLNANLQNLLNERGHTENEARRRLQNQMDSAGRELSSAKRKLNEKIEETERLAQRREFENQQSQARIDDLVKSLGQVREELVEAKTVRDHLQSQVSQMSIDLRSAQEKVQILRSQPQASTAVGSEESDAGREQQLSLEITELRRNLETAEADLATAHVQIEQFKGVAQAVEEELNNINETQDQYRQEMDSVIEEKDKKVTELEGIIEVLRRQVSSTDSELETLRTENAQHDQKFAEQKSSYEMELSQIKDSLERIKTEADFHQADLKAQAEIARQAQENYDNEIIKHGEAASNLQKLRAEFSQIRLEVVESKSALKSAQSNNSQNEEAWSAAKDRYEREVADVKTRLNDAHLQNKALHQQLESVNNQISALQHVRQVHPDAQGEDGESQTQTSSSKGFQEIIKYLRREKEIVDVQYELSAQEVKRLRQQLENAKNERDDARLKLNQARRLEEDHERSVLNHNKLMETINELNLNRESNATLRLEKSQAQAALVGKTKAVEELQAQIQPLNAKIEELEDAVESKAEELRMTREAKERFEQRYHDVLHRTDAIDPAEVEALKEKLAALESERDDLARSRDSLQEEVDGHETKLQEALEEANQRLQQSRTSLINQSKEKARQQNQIIREKDATLQAATTEKQELEFTLETLRQELDAVRIEKNDALREKNEALEASGKAVPAGSEDGQVDEETTKEVTEDQTEISGLKDQLQDTTNRLGVESDRADELQSQLDSAREKIGELEHQINATQASLHEANRRLTALQTSSDDTAIQSIFGVPMDSAAELEKLQNDLTHAQEEVQMLRYAAAPQAGAGVSIGDDGESSVAEQVSAQIQEIRGKLQSEHNEKMQLLEETYQARTTQMKNLLNNKMKERNQENSVAIENLKAEHAEEVETLKRNHENTLEQLKQAESLAVAEARPGDSAQPETTTNGETSVKEESAAKSPVDFEHMSEADIRSLLKNQIVIGIIRKNALATLAKEKETLTENVRKEQENVLKDKLAEAEEKAKTAREQAVQMEAKRQSVKLSMTENRAKAAQVKVDYVSAAAKETPEKAVSEVWDAAKNLKPPAAGPAQTQPQPQPQQQPAPTPSTVSSIGPSTAPSTAKTESTTSSLASGLPAPNVTFSQPSGSTFGQPSTFGQASTLSQSSTASQPKASQPAQAPTPAGGLGQSSHAPQTISRLPDAPLGSGARRPSQGTGPSALRSLQSGLPTRGGSQLPRGATSARGRSRGGRGGIPQVQTQAAGQQQGQQSTGSQGLDSPMGQLSATAKQFVPGKRPREESAGGLEASSHASDNKRQKSDGGGFSG